MTNIDVLSPDWSAARAAMMLDPTVVNLNSGSWGPTPRVVFERAMELRRRLAAEPMDFYLRQMPPLLWTARERLADFLGTSPQRLVFTENVTTAINIVASGLTLEGGGEILMSDREYGAMQWCWERAARRQGLTVRHFHLPLMPREPGEIVEAVQCALTPQTKLVFFSHVYSATGLVTPAAEICAAVRKHGALSVVDGAHAPVQIPLHVDSIGCDVYGGNCHKWLLAPMGAGFLVFSDAMCDRLEPLQVSWGFRPDRDKLDDPDEFGSTPRTRFLEFEGTRDPCSWLAVPDAIDFQSALGFDCIRQRMRELGAYVRRRFADLRLTTPADPRMHGAMTAFFLPAGLHAETLRKRLWDRRIEAVIVEWPDGTTLRVSTHFYTTEAEIDRMADALPELLCPT